MENNEENIQYIETYEQKMNRLGKQVSYLIWGHP